MTKKETKILDNLWSKTVKLKAGNKCEFCGKTNRLNSHHIYSRSKRSTRWDIDNGVCLCSGHHSLQSNFSAHKTPLDFMEWIRARRGETWYKTLQLKANATSKMDYKLEKLYLLQELNKYK